MSLGPEKHEPLAPRRPRQRKHRIEDVASKPVVLARLPYVDVVKQSLDRDSGDPMPGGIPQETAQQPETAIELAMADESLMTAAEARPVDKTIETAEETLSIRIDQGHDRPRLGPARVTPPVSDREKPTLPPRPPAKTTIRVDPSERAEPVRDQSPQLSIVRESVEDEPIYKFDHRPAAQRVAPPKMRADDFRRSTPLRAERSKKSSESKPKTAQTQSQQNSGITEFLIKAIGVILAGALILVAARN